jgi:hypothetical protein
MCRHPCSPAPTRWSSDRAAQVRDATRRRGGVAAGGARRDYTVAGGLMSGTSLADSYRLRPHLGDHYGRLSALMKVEVEIGCSRPIGRLRRALSV